MGLGLDHQHAFAGAGDDQVEVGIFELLHGRVQHVLAVDIADPGTSDRTEERDTGDRQRRRRADEGDDVGIVFKVVAQHGADNLRLV